MIARRDFLQAALAATALTGVGGMGRWSRVAAQQSLSQDQLLQFDTTGNVTLIHITDIHAQMVPVYFREPEFNLGVGAQQGLVPHLTGEELRQVYGIEKGSPDDYALTYDDFVALAQGYGKMGGLDRIATVVRRSAPTGPTRCCWTGATHGRARSLRCAPKGRIWSMP